MAKKNKDKKAAKDDPNQKTVTTNRKARFEYEVLDNLECGIVLVGSEVKSLRLGHVSIDEAYGRVAKGEVWLVNCDIQEYKNATHVQHEPKRWRKLLMHRREISKFAGRAYEKNLTLVPLKMYFKEGKAKVLMGLCKGKKTYDKRESLKEKSAKRDMERALRGR
ncbi:MAG: SsrA-binding protein SmpB [Planctomycetota bacterium]